MRTFAGVLATYAIAGAAGLILYVLSFRLPIGGEILFYRGLLLAAIVALAMLSAVPLIARRFPVKLETVVGAVLSSLALNVCFLVLFPVTIDRSISVFLLARIEANQPLTARELQRIFVDEYIASMNQIPRRVREQVVSGNIELQPDGTITLSPRGESFNALTREASSWFGTDPRFVNPQTGRTSLKR